MKKELVYCTTFLFLAASCNEEAPLLPPSAQTDSDILQLLSARLEEEEKEEGSTPTPRDIITTGTLKTLRLYATEDADQGAPYIGNSGSAYGNYQYQEGENGTNGQWTPTGKQQIKINSNARIYAIYPEDATISATATTGGGTTTYTYQAEVQIQAEDSFAPTKQTDYLYSSNYQTVRSADHKVSITGLKHALAKIAFKVTKINNETMTLTSLALNSKTAKLLTGNGSMNIPGGTISRLGGVPAIILKGTTTLSQTQTDPNVVCLVAPTTLDDLSFELTISETGTGGTTVTRTLTTDQLSKEHSTWEAGKQYVYTISVGQGTIEFKNMKVYGWNDDGKTTVGIQ